MRKNKYLIITCLIIISIIICGAKVYPLHETSINQMNVNKLNNAVKNRQVAIIKNISLLDSRILTSHLDLYNKFTIKDGLWLMWKNNQTIIYAQDYWISKIQDDYVNKFCYNWTKLNYTTDQYDMVLRIKNFIIKHVEYDYKNQQYYRYSAYGALQGKAVCQGITLLAQKMFDQAGIENKLVIDKKQNHSYNSIIIENKYFTIDIT